MRRLPTAPRPHRPALGLLLTHLASLAFLFGVALAPRISSAQSALDEPGTLRIHVRGSAQLQVTSSTDGSALTLRGSLIDDAGSPIAAAALSIQAVSNDSPSTRVALPAPRPCSERPRGPKPRAGHDEINIETDEHGEFCLRADGAIPKASIVVRFAGTKLHDAAEARAPLDSMEPRAARTILRFEHPVEVIDLERDVVPISGSLRVERSEMVPDGAARREGLVITLEDERGTKIAETTTRGDGGARFDVKTAALAGPGSGELRLRFDGALGLAKARATLPIIRRADVTLTLARPLDAGDPDEGVPIEVNASSARGPVDGGVVEALRGVDSVGASSVSGGEARVIATFTLDRPGSVPLTLRYVPAAPWWRAGSPLAVSVPIAGPGIARQILLALVVVLVTAWVVAGWRRAPKPKAALQSDTPAPLSGRAGVQVVAQASGQSGWRGTVCDAHDGTPVHGATLSIVIPSFQGDGVAARATTDERGSFSIDATGMASSSGARLVVESTEHSSYEQSLPPPSVLAVALVTRRRAMLDRLVRWARRQGAPFDGPPEPTPGHVRRVASRSNIPDVEEWAQRLEHVAFGPEPIDAQIEQHVRSTEPKGGRP